MGSTDHFTAIYSVFAGLPAARVVAWQDDNMYGYEMKEAEISTCCASINLEKFSTESHSYRIETGLRYRFLTSPTDFLVPELAPNAQFR